MQQSAEPRPRALRDRAVGRAVMLAVVLLLAFAVTKGCGSDGSLDADDAKRVAQTVQTFEPDEVQVRFFRRGVNSTPLWAVSMYQGTAKRPTRVQVVVINATTGEIVEEGA